MPERDMLVNHMLHEKACYKYLVHHEVILIFQETPMTNHEPNAVQVQSLQKLLSTNPF